MRVVYTGRYPAVTVPALGLTAQRGVPVEVPAEVAEPLLTQPGWTAEPTRKPKPRKEDE